MSIDERIRAGLARNAEVPLPPVEDHLVAVRRRHRRRTAVRAVVTMAVVAILGAVPLVVVLNNGGRDPHPIGRPHIVTGCANTNSPPSSLQRTWIVDRTRAEMVEDLGAAGFARFANDFFQAEHLGQRAVLAVTFESDRFQIAWLQPDHTWQVGWYGDARERDGVLTITDAEDHSKNSYAWNVCDGLLTLRFLRTTTPDQHGIPFEAYNRAYFTRPLRAANCTPADLNACL